MTYIDSWEEFSKAAEILYMQAPWKARFVVKYRHCDEKLVCKVTDDKVTLVCVLSGEVVILCAHIFTNTFIQCLKYKTDQLQDVKKLEKLGSTLMRLMVSKEHK